MSLQSITPVSEGWSGHAKGSREYRRLLAALFFAGVATFAQLYSPQAVLPQIAQQLGIGAADAALTISLATIGLAMSVIPWSVVADRVGRVRAMTVSVAAATTLGLLVPLAPTYPVLLGGRFLEGLALGGVPAVAIAYLTEEVDRRHAARAAGTYVAGTTIGGLLDGWSPARWPRRHIGRPAFSRWQYCAPSPPSVSLSWRRERAASYRCPPGRIPTAAWRTG